jgi:hypothetical protein
MTKSEDNSSTTFSPNLLRSGVNGGLLGKFPSSAGSGQWNMRLKPAFVVASGEE